MRIILYTGKGGVGKTSVAAATALRCAELGQRTIVLSTDAAHSLADSFDLKIGREPIEIAPRLHAQEIDVLYQMDKYWGKVQDYFRSLLQWRGVDELIADEVSVLPGMDELASLLQIVHLAESGRYDVIIVDCAPTGETLKLLSLPEVARWYLTHIFPVERMAARFASPFMRAMTDIPMPDDQVFATIKELIQQLDRMAALLGDTKTSSVRVVLNPEKMVIKEAQRTFTYINLYGFACDLVISNRILPDSITDPYFAALKESQARYGKLIEESFAPVPIFQVPFFDHEVVGLEMLRRTAQSAYGDQDPARIFYEGSPQEIEKNGSGYVLKMKLPFAATSDVHLTRAGDELAISVGNFRRNAILPRALASLEVQKAKMDDGKLVINFA
ncbi:MAG: ArsA family ATPase [Chloroflexota bacterium]|nr:MAG: ArsA family ATPase [Chloroflexota bacterium]